MQYQLLLTNIINTINTSLDLIFETEEIIGSKNRNENQINLFTTK